MGSSKSSLLYLNVVRGAAALCCALLWLRSYLMSRDLFTNARMETLPYCYWTATSLSNYRNGKNPSLQSRPQLLPSPSFTCRGRRQKKPHKVIGALKKVFLARSYVVRVVTIKRFYWATQYNQICEESNLQFNGVSYITSLFFSELKLLVNS